LGGAATLEADSDWRDITEFGRTVSSVLVAINRLDALAAQRLHQPFRSFLSTFLILSEANWSSALRIREITLPDCRTLPVGLQYATFLQQLAEKLDRVVKTTISMCPPISREEVWSSTNEIPETGTHGTRSSCSTRRSDTTTSLMSPSSASAASCLATFGRDAQPRLTPRLAQLRICVQGSRRKVQGHTIHYARSTVCPAGAFGGRLPAFIGQYDRTHSRTEQGGG
jgi:hypothetical protein